MLSEAEAADRAFRLLVDTQERLIVAMQAAFIEWKHGAGAESGMEWIANTLDGPGLIPDPEDEDFNPDAQAYFDANSPALGGLIAAEIDK